MTRNRRLATRCGTSVPFGFSVRKPLSLCLHHRDGRRSDLPGRLIMILKSKDLNWLICSQKTKRGTRRPAEKSPKEARRPLVLLRLSLMVRRYTQAQTPGYQASLTLKGKSWYEPLCEECLALLRKRVSTIVLSRYLY